MAAGLTQEELAERARLSLAAIGKLERGARQRPYRATVALLADALSLAPNDCLKLECAARGALLASQPADDAGTAIHLPVHFSAFVGRERDLENVGEMLATHRLVTLAGAGGVGKTRLAIRAAERFIVAADPTRHQLDGAWFVDFSTLSEGAMVPIALASSIGVPHCRTIAALITYLRSQAFLLILDNCEHLLDPIAHAVNAIVSSCPNGRVLATSRQALSVGGERIYRVPPMSLPDAMELFKERAEATDSRFELADSIIPAVENICRRVDGIALAIELAAARTNAFSPAVIAEQLGERFSLLSGGTRTSLPRHETMNALFDWSYDLLDAAERELFRRSGIFAGGFTLDLVSALEGDEKRDAPRKLARLVDKSFVQCDIHAGPRYRLLEPARHYALQKLRERREYDRAARSHALALLALAEYFDSKLELTPDHVWYAQIERERDNFRAAFQWALGPHGDAAIAQRLAASRTATWSGFASGEVREWVGAALETCGESTALAVPAKLAINAARTAAIFGPSWHPKESPDARVPDTRVDECRRALALQSPDDLRAVGLAQYWLGVALRDCGRYDEADNALRQARAAARSVGAQTEYNAATTSLGAVRYGAGDLTEARALITEALQLSEAAGSDRVAADARVALAEVEFASGRVKEALELNEKTAGFFRSHSNLIGLPLPLCNSAACLVVLERYDEAREYAAEALRRSLAIGSVHCAFWAMQHLAAAAVFGSGPSNNNATLQRAANMLGFVDEATTQRGIPRYVTEQQEYEKMIFALREALGDDRLASCMAAGKAWTEEQAAAEAFAI
jgi:predicted ATPase/DNA-binding XRE family transcriptional regulator